MDNEIHPTIRRVFTILVLIALAFAGYWFFAIGALDWFSNVNWSFEWSKAQGPLIVSASVGLIFSIIAFQKGRRLSPGVRAFVWTAIVMLFFTPAIVTAPFAGTGIAPACMALLAVIIMPVFWPLLIPNIFYSIILYQILRYVFQRKADLPPPFQSDNGSLE